MKVSIGLIGAGRMGTVLAHQLVRAADKVDFVAVADADGKRAQEVAGRLQVADYYDDYRRLLDRSDVVAVVIATPTNTHAAVIRSAAGAGKHIFTEKPLALTLEECDAALEAVAKAGVKLHVGFMRRYDAAYYEAKSKIQDGAIGTPVIFKAVGRDSWRPTAAFARRENSGGLLMDMAIHDFDVARWLMDDEVIRVYSEGSCLVYPELQEAGDVDNAVVSLKFAGGAVGSVDVSRNAVYGYDIRTEVVGSDGGLMIGHLQQTATLALTRNGVIHDTYPGFMERFSKAYAAEITDFVDTIASDRQPSVTGADGRAATAIGVAANLSLDEARPVMIEEVG